MESFNLTPTASLIFLLVTLASLASFLQALVERIRAMQWGTADPRFDQPLKRIRQTLKYAIGQYRMPQELGAGLFHIFIFAGFFVVSLRTLSLFGVGITGTATFSLPLLSEADGLGRLYIFLKDIVAGLVILGCLGFAYRRLILRPVRLRNVPQGEAILILVFILVLMVTDLFMDGTLRAAAAHTSLWPAPFGALVARGLPAGVAGALFFQMNLWLHCLVILVFLNYLPFGKHFHIITAIPNVFFSRLEPHGRLVPIHDIESTLEAALEGEGNLGTKEVQDLSWKMILDTYSCTECGRCVPQCPAWATSKPLSLRDVNLATRHHLMEKFEALDGESPRSSATSATWEGGPLTGGAIGEETIWACTLCRDCEERCPVLIEMVPRIVEMRRHLNMMESSFPPELNKLFTAIERNSNPWSIAQADRGQWLEGTDIKRLADDAGVEYLFFVGCMGSYDAAAIKTSKALAKILQAAGIKFGVLAEEESCNGETVRRLGNEYLAQSLIAANIETFKRYGVKKIVTNCPHCFNTLKNEYPDFGGHYQVEHSNELVDRLVREKRISLRGEDQVGSIAFHDPCFLGRYNGTFDEPRALIRNSGGRLRESPLSREESFCCGAGGGRMWMEEKDPKINLTRFDEITESCGQPSTIGVSCPFCKTMLTDASKARGKEDQVGIKDVIELIAERIEGSA